LKRGRIIQAIEAALNGCHDGRPKLSESMLREILMILRDSAPDAPTEIADQLDCIPGKDFKEAYALQTASEMLRQGGVQWPEDDYRRARDCMLGILRDDAWTIDIGGEAWFDNAFQHAVGILSLTATKASQEEPGTKVMTDGYNRLRDALDWFTSHEVEKKLGHLPQWVIMARELIAPVSRS
jgi:hypothetical protein